MKLHKPPTILIKLENANPSTGIGYIYLKVLVPGTKKYIARALSLKAHKDFWDKENEMVLKNGKDAARINDIISRERRAMQKLIDQAAEAGTVFDEMAVRNMTNPDVSYMDFMKFFADHVRYVKSKWSHNYYISFNTAYNTFRAFAGDKLPFSAINAALLEEYEMRLRNGLYKAEGEEKAGLASTTIANRTRKLSEVINKAIDRGLIKPQQVRGYKFPPYIEPETEYLTLEQVNKIGELIYGGSLDHDVRLKAAACFFMLECCGGIRFSDWNNFKVETLISGRNFKVRTTKTKSVVYLDLDVFRSLDKVIQYIQANNIVFDLQMKTTNDKLKIIGGMIGLKFGLTTHVGRHSFGTLLGEIGYTTRFIGQAMGISERTAQRYVAITRQSMDNEMQNKGGF